MTKSKQDRRNFLKTSAAATAAGVFTPYWMTAERDEAHAFAAKGDRPLVGQIGCGGRGNGITGNARKFGDVVAVCDVDRGHAEASSKRHSDGKAAIYEDYRKVLDRKDVDVVTIGTPDHWHTKIAIEAM